MIFFNFLTIGRSIKSPTILSLYIKRVLLFYLFELNTSIRLPFAQSFSLSLSLSCNWKKMCPPRFEIFCCSGFGNRTETETNKTINELSNTEQFTWSCNSYISVYHLLQLENLKLKCPFKWCFAFTYLVCFLRNKSADEFLIRTEV